MEHEIKQILLDFYQKLNFASFKDLINTAEEIKEIHISMDCFDCKASENNSVLKAPPYNLEDVEGITDLVYIEEEQRQPDLVNVEYEPGKANYSGAADEREEMHSSLDSVFSTQDSDKSLLKSKPNYLNTSNANENSACNPSSIKSSQNQSFSFPKFILSSGSDEEEIVILRRKKRKSVCVRKQEISSESSQCSSDEYHIDKKDKQNNENENSGCARHSSQSINLDSSINTQKHSKNFKERNDTNQITNEEQDTKNDDSENSGSEKLNEKYHLKQKTDSFESESDFDDFINQSKKLTNNKSDSKSSLFIPLKHDYNNSVLELIESDYDGNNSVFQIKSPSLINTLNFVNYASPLSKPVYNICSETPKQNTGPLKKLNSVLKTPKSAVKNVINQYAIKSVPGTPAYKREFCKVRDQCVRELFTLFNKTVFDSQLPTDLSITWNKRMTKTAGFCYYKSSLGARCSSIELSDKVVDSADRVRDTLIHELCHAAVWLIDGMKGGHGPRWKYWATRSNRVYPDLPVISRCHQYDINYKYIYKCEGCGVEVGRHSKSVDSNKHNCIRCDGNFILTNPSSTNKRTPSAYANFLKINFAIVKKNNPALSHKELMMKIAADFHDIKLNDKEN